MKMQGHLGSQTLQVTNTISKQILTSLAYNDSAQERTNMALAPCFFTVLVVLKYVQISTKKYQLIENCFDSRTESKTELSS